MSTWEGAAVTILLTDNLGKSYGAEVVFSGIHITVGRGDRVGVVGPNGAGKTTLLEMIVGRLEPTSGSIRLVGRPRVGYLEQEVRFRVENGVTLYEHALLAMSTLARREERLDEIEREMAAAEPGSLELGELMEEYGALRDAFEREGGYRKEARVKEVLFGLGFTQDHFALPIGKLSGGQRTRAHLARLLLEEPDLLLLDEPTNHLDLEAVEWLEGFLRTFPGSIVAVSHDRYFLDNVARKIVEIEHGRATTWNGNYTAYVKQKEAWLERARETYERQEAEIERLEDYVRRYIAGNRTTMAQSRLKAIARIEREMGERPRTSEPKAGIRFAETELTGREVLKLRGAGLAFPDDPDTWLFRGLTAIVWRGQRVALLGRNGVGKSTLLEVAIGRRKPTAGEVAWGAGVNVGYFSQGLDNLSDERTVLEEVMMATGYDVPTARSFLGRFLFSGDDVFRPVAALSGGERNRLVLACLVAAKPNVLVLDEPTNHLDLPAREALEKAILEFHGTVIFVSHDRYFVEKLATRIWELDGGSLVDFVGGYREFREWRAESRAKAAAAPGEPPRRTPGPAAGEPPRRRPGSEASEPAGLAAYGGTDSNVPAGRLSKNQLARMAKELDAAQDEVDRLERRRAEIEALMADPTSYRDGGGADLAAEYRAVLGDLERALARWEELALALEVRK